jgi:hypothetical protein
MEARLALAGSESGPGLLLCYDVIGDTAGLRLPPPAKPGRADGLWQHTCFEVFAGLDGESAYREFNFAPSGQWAAYHFLDQRQRDENAEATWNLAETPIHCAVAPRSLRLQAWLPLDALPARSAAARWTVGLTAVIETTDGQLSYWALRHPGSRPDFHHRGGWQRLPELSALLSSSPTP